MNIPTDRIYKFLAVIGFLVMSGSIAAWLHSRLALQEHLAVAKGAAAVVAETHAQLAEEVQLAKELQDEAERQLFDSRRHYDQGNSAAGDDAFNESVARNSGARERIEASELLLKDLGVRKIEERQISASATLRSEGHNRLFWVLFFGFLSGLSVFTLSCLAWWGESRSNQLPEA